MTAASTNTKQKAKFTHTAMVPTSTVLQSRLQMFQATRRPVRLNQTFETAFGSVRIKGRLGQQHADVLQSILFCTENKGEVAGTIKLLVDPAAVRRTANITSGSQFQGIIDDLKQVIIEIKIKKPSPPPTPSPTTEETEVVTEKNEDMTPQTPQTPLAAELGSLIKGIGYCVDSSGVKITRRNPLGGTREMWKVDLGQLLCHLIKEDIWLTYDPSPVAKISHGISQAITRHVLTHQASPQGGWKLNGLIMTVDGEQTSQQLKDRRREVKNDVAAMLEAGVRVEDDRVFKV